MKPKNETKKPITYRFHGNMSNQSTMSLEIIFNDGKDHKNLQNKALANTINKLLPIMIKKGFLSPEVRFMSPSDVAKEYGSTRQHWEKLINEGRIPSKRTSAGTITTDLWVKGYLGKKERVNEYFRNMRKAIRDIETSGQTGGTIKCPQCKESSFRFAVNQNSNQNGTCSKCDFKINTIK